MISVISDSLLSHFLLQGGSALDKDIGFAVNICDELDISVQITACTRIVQLLNQMTQLHDAQG